MVDARLPDGSRVNVIFPPLAIDSPCISIRKFPASRLRLSSDGRQRHDDRAASRACWRSPRAAG